MAHMLDVNHSLKELHLGKHGMTDCGLQRLCEALISNHSLRYLDLRWYTHSHTVFVLYKVNYLPRKNGFKPASRDLLILFWWCSTFLQQILFTHVYLFNMN